MRARSVRVWIPVPMLAGAATVSAELFLSVDHTDSGEILEISIPGHEVIG